MAKLKEHEEWQLQLQNLKSRKDLQEDDPIHAHMARLFEEQISEICHFLAQNNGSEFTEIQSVLEKHYIKLDDSN